MLIHELSQVKALKVISRNGVAPYRKSTVSDDSISRALKVGTIVRGSVVGIGDSVRVEVAVENPQGDEVAIDHPAGPGPDRPVCSPGRAGEGGLHLPAEARRPGGGAAGAAGRHAEREGVGAGAAGPADGGGSGFARGRRRSSGGRARNPPCGLDAGPGGAAGQPVGCADRAARVARLPAGPALRRRLPESVRGVDRSRPGARRARAGTRSQRPRCARGAGEPSAT